MSEQTVEVQARDGVPLATDVRLPDGDGPWPTVLFRSPYHRSNEMLPLWPGPDTPFAVALQDVRGRHDSGGEFAIGGCDLEDGADTLAWIAGQPWSDGRVSMYGVSYAGHTQLQAARARPPALAGIAPIRCPAWWRPLTLHEGGALALSLAAHWLPMQAAEAPECTQEARRQLLEMALSFDQICDYPPGPPTAQGTLNLKHLFGHPWLARRPLRERPQYDGAPRYGRIWRDLFDSPFTRLWSDDDGPAPGDEPACPVLLMGGWYDCWAEDTVRMFAQLRRRRPQGRHQLIMAPFSHAPEPAGTLPLGPNAGRFDDWTSIAWTRELLLDEARGFAAMAPVTYFMVNANRWLEATTWPPEGAATVTLFLAAGNGRAHGELLERPPDDGAGVQFVYDPCDPMPTMGGAQLGLPAGPIEQSSVDAHHRSDVCSFTGAVLGSDLDLAGPVTAEIHLATDARDTDVVIKLIDVFPDGRAYNIADGIVRGRFVAGDGVERLLDAGVHRFRVHCWDIAYRVQAGHRLRCDVTSSSFPKYEPNPNTGAPLGTDRQEDLRPARQTVMTGSAHASCVRVTFLPP